MFFVIFPKNTHINFSEVCRLNKGEYLSLKIEWSKQINLHWKYFLDSKIIETLFAFPQINDFIKSIIWYEASVRYFGEKEEATISFLHQDYSKPLVVVVVLYDTDYSMYLYSENRYTTFSSFFDTPNLDKWIWKMFWEFDLFGYIYDYQKIVDNHNIKK